MYYVVYLKCRPYFSNNALGGGSVRLVVSCEYKASNDMMIYVPTRKDFCNLWGRCSPTSIRDVYRLRLST